MPIVITKKLAGLHTTSLVLLELNLMTLCYNGREALPETWNLFGKEQWCRSTSKFSSCYTLGALMGDLTLVVEKCVCMCVCVCVCVCYLLSCVWLVVTPWTVTCQAPLSMKFSKQEYWSRLLFPSPGDLPDPGIKLGSPALQVDSK